MRIDGIPVVDGHMPIPVGAIEPLDHGYTEAGSIIIKWVLLRKGERVLQHIHPHSHATLVIDGEVEVIRDGKAAGRFGPMKAIDVPAGVKHELVALTPARVACVHCAACFEE